MNKRVDGWGDKWVNEVEGGKEWMGGCEWVEMDKKVDEWVEDGQRWMEDGMCGWSGWKGGR